MKKIWMLGVVLCCAAYSLWGQEAGGFTLGAGVEGNMNTPSAAAAGASLSAVFGLNRALSLGLKGTVSHNFAGVLTVEPEALFRWYALPLGRTVLFFQAGLCSSLIVADGALFPVPMGGLAAGLRLSLGSLVIEPMVRAGYPFIWGAGITVARRFGTSGPAGSPDELLRR
jgi:hypothetical protein